MTGRRCMANRAVAILAIVVMATAAIVTAGSGRAQDGGSGQTLSVELSAMQSAGTVTYQIRLRNTGDSDIENVTVGGTVPMRAVFRRQMLTAPVGAVPQGLSNGTVTWTVAAVTAGASMGPLTYQVDAPADADADALAARATANWDGGEARSDRTKPVDAASGGGAPPVPETPDGTTQQPQADADGEKHVSLTAQVVNQELLNAEGKRVVAKAFGFDGSTPGPTLVFTIGDRVAITITNELPEATAIHFHGVIVPNEMDGVPEIEPSPLLAPGESFTYRFTVQQTGTHMYHSHVDSAKQDLLGLAGALIFLPKQEIGPKVDHDFVYFLNEWKLPQDLTPEQIAKMPRTGSPVDTVNSVTAEPQWTSMELNFFSMNGKAFPSSTPLRVELGERIRIRFFNIGMNMHPMHLHGQDFMQTEQDGNSIAPDNQPELNVITVAPGQTQAIEFDAVNAGNWPLHCHVAHHQTNNLSSGFGGMATFVQITAPGNEAATPAAGPFEPTVEPTSAGTSGTAASVGDTSEIETTVPDAATPTEGS